MRYQNANRVPLALVSVSVTWAGSPFVLEQEVRGGKGEGRIEVFFDGDHTLSVGRAEFEVKLFREDGAMSSFVRNIYVLPSNPLSLYQ